MVSFAESQLTEDVLGVRESIWPPPGASSTRPTAAWRATCGWPGSLMTTSPACAPSCWGNPRRLCGFRRPNRRVADDIAQSRGAFCRGRHRSVARRGALQQDAGHPYPGGQQCGGQFDADRQRHPLTAYTVDAQALRWSRRCASSARYTPSTNPRTRPATGITKNPMMPSTAPAAMLRPLTSAAHPAHRPQILHQDSRAEHRGDHTQHHQDAVVRTTTAHTAIAAQTNSVPGSNGTKMPTKPTAMANATRISPPVLTTPQSYSRRRISIGRAPARCRR